MAFQDDSNLWKSCLRRQRVNIGLPISRGLSRLSFDNLVHKITYKVFTTRDESLKHILAISVQSNMKIYCSLFYCGRPQDPNLGSSCSICLRLSRDASYVCSSQISVVQERTPCYRCLTRKGGGLWPGIVYYFFSLDVIPQIGFLYNTSINHTVMDYFFICSAHIMHCWLCQKNKSIQFF